MVTNAEMNGIRSDAVHLSLISHTNAGKTTLARTLLGHDIGEVRDAAHVTEVAEAHPMLELEGGPSLMLWDTPGFGDTARLLRRLKLSGNPVGWLLTQVWDRYADRPFWCSQQAIRNARDHADVVLYLVNASEDPEDAGYVALEMQIMEWIAKPVIVLLNQMGPPREESAMEERRWEDHLGRFPAVRDVLAMDAFARCWVQEGVLLQRVTEHVPQQKRTAMKQLAAAWQEKNHGRFQSSMKILALQLARAACDKEPIDMSGPAGRFQELVKVLKRQPNDPQERAMASLAQRLDQQIRESTGALIAAHGLDGRATGEVLKRVRENYAASRSVREGYAAMFGGLASGALGGLAADLAAGGLTLGGGMLAGGILGALGAGGLARGFNLIRGEKHPSVRWSEEFFTGLVEDALLRYLAVAHFGRGRGDYVQSESPPFWREAVHAIIADRRSEIAAAWTEGRHSTSPEPLQADLLPVLVDCGKRLLAKLYPGAQALY